MTPKSKRTRTGLRFLGMLKNAINMEESGGLAALCHHFAVAPPWHPATAALGGERVSDRLCQRRPRSQGPVIAKVIPGVRRFTNSHMPEGSKVTPAHSSSR